MKALAFAILLPGLAGAADSTSQGPDDGIRFILEEGSGVSAGSGAARESDSGPSLEFRAMAGPASSTYRMESASGHNVHLAATIGYKLGLAADYRASDTFALELQASQKRTEFAPLVGITSSPLEVRERQVDLASRHSIGKGFYIRPAYRFQYREAPEVSPVAVVTSAVTHGLSLGLGVEVTAKGRWKVDIWAGAYIPVYYQEKFQRTGSSTFRGGVEAQNRFQYLLGPKFGIGLAPKFSLQFHTYSGVGERSVRDARERWMEISLPVEIGLLF